MNHGFEILMHYLRSPKVGLSTVAGTALEYIFTFFTLGIVVIYVAADFVTNARDILRKAGLLK